MSAATSGGWGWSIPGYRCAHAGYSLASSLGSTAKGSSQAFCFCEVTEQRKAIVECINEVAENRMLACVVVKDLDGFIP